VRGTGKLLKIPVFRELRASIAWSPLEKADLTANDL